MKSLLFAEDCHVMTMPSSIEKIKDTEFQHHKCLNAI